MTDFLYDSKWGAFAVMLFFHIPFLIEAIWIAVAAALFILVNVLSVVYMPPVSTAAMSKSGTDFQETNIMANSWYYDMSNREFEVGKPVKFSAKSGDTVHGFALYHPSGDVLFTMMLMPGMKNSTSLIHTFSEPGTYTVRCLEYCGLQHHEMRDEIVVVN